MSNKKTKNLRDITFGDNITLLLPSGEYKTFKTIDEAQNYFDSNYKGYHIEYPEEMLTNYTLPEVTITPEIVNPIILNIYKGKYNGKSFVPTLDNINYYLDLYKKDKLIEENYGAKAQGKVLGTHAAAATGIYGTEAYAFPWLVKNIFPYLTAQGWLASTQATRTTPIWLTPTTATAIDASLVGGATGASINDIVLNGPSVGNVVGTGLGITGLGIEAMPIVRLLYLNGKRTYNIYKFNNEFNKAIQASKFKLNLLPEGKIITYEKPKFRPVKYSWQQRPSKLTAKEKAGIPRGERNLPINPPLLNFGTIEYTDQGVRVPKLGTPLGSGSESYVFDNGDRVNKIVTNPWIDVKSKSVNQEFTKESIGDFVKNFIIRRNRHPIFEPMRFEGVVSNYGRLVPVVSLRKLTPVSSPVVSKDRLASIYELLYETLKKYNYVKLDNSLIDGYSEYRNNIGTISDLSILNLGYTSDGKLKALDLLAYKKGGQINKEN